MASAAVAIPEVVKVVRDTLTLFAEDHGGLGGRVVEIEDVQPPYHGRFRLHVDGHHFNVTVTEARDAR